MKIASVLIVCLTTSCLAAAAGVERMTVVDGDDIAFGRVENTEAFSQSRIGQMAQDDKGFLWFGTQYGLHRFDGYGHTVFAADSRVPHQLSGVFIRAIHKQRSGKLWIASDRGLDIFDPAVGLFEHVDFAGVGETSPAIQSFHEDRDGTMWLCTSGGLYGLDGRGRMKVHFQHAADDANSLSSNDLKFAKEDRAGTFWVTSSAGLDAIDRTDGRVLRRVALREPRELDFLEDRAGTFWVYQAGGRGLATLDRNTGTLTKFEFVDASGTPLAPFGVYTALEDRSGALWFGTGGAGLLRFDPGHRRFVRYRNNSGDPRSLSGDDVVTLFQDRQDNIWVSLHGMPLNLFPAQKPSFRKLPARPAAIDERAETMVNTILERDDGSLWISFVGMLLGVDPRTGARENLRQELKLTSDVISMAQDARGRVWLGTTGSGLVGVEPSGRVLRFHHDPADPRSLADDVVNDVFVDHAQNVWLATWGGLSRYDEKTGDFANFRPPGMDVKYLSLAEDREHRLWMGTHLFGLQRFDPATGAFDTYPSTGAPGSISNARLNAVHVDRRGIVWAGTQNGLDALDPATGRITSYHIDDGLPGNAVSCILEDDRDGIWVGTNNGIARVAASTGEIRKFTRADGLPGLDFTGWGSCFRSKSGEMYFAGFAGATAFDPERVRALSVVTSVEFTDLSIAGRPYPEGLSDDKPLVLPEIPPLTLPYSLNTFAAGFAALNYGNPAANRYRFRLSGLEESWHTVGSDRRVASYNSLPPGKYRLEVQGAAGTGPWSATKALDLTILKPWWQGTLFRFALCLFVLGIAALAYRLRVRKVLNEFEMRLNERVGERTRIARELHDSLLQGFHGLMYRLQAVRNLLPAKPQQAAQALDEALTRGDETVEQARVAVTDLRTFGSAQTELEAALRDMGHDLPMLKRADAPEFRVAVEGTPRALIPLVRDDVLQIAREAFRNAVAHGQAKLVSIEVTWGDERFSLRVRDDGIGMDPKLIALGRDGHWGFQGMRERTRQVGGSLEIRCEGGNGTLVELGIPAARAYAKSAPSPAERHSATV